MTVRVVAWLKIGLLLYVRPHHNRCHGLQDCGVLLAGLLCCLAILVHQATT